MLQSTCRPLHLVASGTIRVPQLMNGDTIDVYQRGVGSAGVPSESYHDSPPSVVQRPFVATVLEAISSGKQERCLASLALTLTLILILTLSLALALAPILVLALTPALALALALALTLSGAMPFHGGLRAANRCSDRQGSRPLLWRPSGRLLGEACHVGGRELIGGGRVVRGGRQEGQRGAR